MPSARPIQKVVEYVTPDHLKPQVQILEDRIRKIRAELGLLGDVRSLHQVIDGMHVELQTAIQELTRTRILIDELIIQSREDISAAEQDFQQRRVVQIQEISSARAAVDRDRQALGILQANHVLRESELDAKATRLHQLKTSLDEFSDRLLTWQYELRAREAKEDVRAEESTRVFDVSCARDQDADRKLAVIVEKEEELKRRTDELALVQKQNDRDRQAIEGGRAGLNLDLRILATDRQAVDTKHEETTKLFMRSQALWDETRQLDLTVKARERELKKVSQAQELKEADLIKLQGKILHDQRLVEGARNQLVKKAAKDAEGS